MLIISSWNVNSLKVRLPHVQEWLQKNQPDVLALQETKLQDVNFPVEAFSNQGWHVAFAGQKTFNGVAIISKYPGVVKATELPGFADPQRRVLAAEINGTLILNIYVPNGQSLNSDKYEYKLAWLKALRNYIVELHQQYKRIVVLGDFNIAPADIDVYDPLAWQGNVLVSPQERQHFEQLLSTGLTDAFRLICDEQYFSWWDYRQAAFRRNRGLRIDHILISTELKQNLQGCWIDQHPRTLERPSDHAPVVAKFSE